MNYRETAKIYVGIILLLYIILISCSGNQDKKQIKPSKVNYEYLYTNFKNPPKESGVTCWWWWLNSHVTKDAISKDLEAMHSRGFSGATIYDGGGQNQAGNRDIPAGPRFGSPDWCKLYEHALNEAERLGMTLGLIIQSGWNLGGPMVTPEQAAKQLTYSEIYVSGPGKIVEEVPEPKTKLNYYKDIVLLAFPDEKQNKENGNIKNLNEKLLFKELGGSTPDCRFLLDDSNSTKIEVAKPEEASHFIKRKDVIDISSQMDKNGKLNWDAPEGAWTIVRIGYTCSGAHVSTSSNNWGGLVIDYLREDAFKQYWNEVVDPLLKLAGSRAGSVLKYLETDSWECGGMNWTNNIPKEFKEYRGYDLISYLPIITGRVVEDMRTTNAFLADFRKTLGDMVANNHCRVFAEYAHKYNMEIQPESGGPHAGPFDAIKSLSFSDNVMAEFWAPSPHRPNPETRFFVKQSASVAHIYGKKIIGAEGFSSIGPHWNNELWHDIKPSFDYAICEGLNKLFFSTFTCSPDEMGLPGQEFFACTHINPRLTWWKQSVPFFDYFNRCQHIVQNGKFVGDVLYYYGDHVPNLFPYKGSDPAGAMPGFDYDVTGEDILLKLKVEGGKLLVPGGVKYEVLVLPNHKILSLAVLEKVEELLNQGARIIGPKPEKLVSLVDGKDAQKRFQKLADKIWGDQISEPAQRAYGKGQIAWGMSAREFLLSNKIKPDFNISSIQKYSDFEYIHYVVNETDIYFVCNQTAQPKDITCTFRVSGARPELWNALNGEIREANVFSQAEGLTSIPLHLDPNGSVFVVFNKKIGPEVQGTGRHNYANYRSEQELVGSWEVCFDPAWGGPKSVIFPELKDWVENDNKEIKYYSGKATYNKTFRSAFEPVKNIKYFLHLESVKDVGIAEVRLNGKNMGIVWTNPFRFDITDALRFGENKLEIDVVNSWYNRLIGDNMLPKEKQLTNTNIAVTDKWQLQKSGLVGSVTIESEVN